LLGNKLLRHALFSFKDSEGKNPFSLRTGNSPFTSGFGGRQTANGIKATAGSGYAGLPLD